MSWRPRCRSLAGGASFDIRARPPRMLVAGVPAPRRLPDRRPLPPCPVALQTKSSASSAKVGVRQGGGEALAGVAGAACRARAEPAPGRQREPTIARAARAAAGTFGRVLECWDRNTKDYVAVKIVRNVDKYRHAAMIEVRWGGGGRQQRHAGARAPKQQLEHAAAGGAASGSPKHALPPTPAAGSAQHAGTQRPGDHQALRQAQGVV